MKTAAPPTKLTSLGGFGMHDDSGLYLLLKVGE